MEIYNDGSTEGDDPWNGRAGGFRILASKGVVAPIDPAMAQEMDGGLTHTAESNGVRTWDLGTPHMKPLENLDASFGVKKYETKCDSVKDMIRILNTHPAYEEFRIERQKQLDKGKWNYRKLLLGITAWSTNPNYIQIIWTAIVDNNLP